MIKKFFVRLACLFDLGLSNVVTVLIYRLSMRINLFKYYMPKGIVYTDSLFYESTCGKSIKHNPNIISDTIEQAEKLLAGNIQYFSNNYFTVGNPPQWFLNPISRKRFEGTYIHWSNLNDFKDESGDIKIIWDISRYDWTIVFAKAYCLTGELKYMRTLNEWVKDWTSHNPLNIGPNWKCGQEASIRMLQLLLAAYLLNQYLKPSNSLIRFVREHCERVSPTIRYAIAQDNNHGTSEAVALFVGGAWLEKVSDDNKLKKKAKNWNHQGRYWIENLISKLVATDGSFSLYSLNYHRILIDTLNIVEFWRRELNIGMFSDLFYTRSLAAVEWLYQMTDMKSGDVPNIGANDGSRLYVLSSSSYRDYRSSVQLGAVLFKGGGAYGEGPWDEPLFWLGLNPCENRKHISKKQSQVFPDGGYVTIYSNGIVKDDSWGVLRFPHYHFRPGHADALHFDLWFKGLNILRDSGTYSYDIEDRWQKYFPGTSSHNTIQFDGRDQMPRIGRFLFGGWLRMDHVGDLIQSNGALSWTGSYTDFKGCRHKRNVMVDGYVWRIVDEIDGFNSNAVLRWRLVPGDWQIKGLRCFSVFANINIECSKRVVRFELVEGWESRYYMQKTKLPVLEIQFDPGKTTITTEISLKG